MQYFYIAKDNNEQGPLDENAIIQLVGQKVISPSTQLRTNMLKSYKDAEKFNFLADSFKTQSEVKTPPKAAKPNQAKPELSLIGGFTERFGDKPDTTTSYKNEKTYKLASIPSRIWALVIDLIIFAIAALIIFTPVLSKHRTIEKIEPASVVQAEEPSKNPEINPVAQTAEPAQTAVTSPPAATADDNGIFANVNRATSGGAAGNAARMISPTLKRVEQMNTDRNKAINKEINDGKKVKPKKTPKEKKPATTFANSNAAQTPSTPAAKPSESSPETPETPAVKPKIEEQLKEKLLETTKVFNNFHIYPIETQNNKITVKVDDSILYHYDKIALYQSMQAGFILLGIFIFLYYSLMLAYFSQTVGMWYMGIFIIRKNRKEVFFFRALFYTFCMILFGIMMIPAVLLSRSSLADWLCGIKIIYVYTVPSKD